mmetsp:Transcript_100875/g.323774  ORF Transcript_100875/g.323774 Transcript_100875/m.323774 type:complete len:236 (+) Transcript_100875:687-1394(+)
MPSVWSLTKRRWNLVGVRPRNVSDACDQKPSGCDTKPSRENMLRIDSCAQRPVPGERKSGTPAEVDTPAPMSATTRRLRPERKRSATPAIVTSPRRTSRRSSRGMRLWPPRRAKYFRLDVSLAFCRSRVLQKSRSCDCARAERSSWSMAAEASPPCWAAKCMGVQPPSSSAVGSADAASRALMALRGAVFWRPACKQRLCSGVLSPKSPAFAAPGSAANRAARATVTSSESSSGC